MRKRRRRIPLFEGRTDEARFLRGVAYGALFSIPLWALIVFVIIKL